MITQKDIKPLFIIIVVLSLCVHMQRPLTHILIYVSKLLLSKCCNLRTVQLVATPPKKRTDLGLRTRHAASQANHQARSRTVQSNTENKMKLIENHVLRSIKISVDNRARKSVVDGSINVVCPHIVVKHFNMKMNCFAQAATSNLHH